MCNVSALLGDVNCDYIVGFDNVVCLFLKMLTELL